MRRLITDQHVPVELRFHVHPEIDGVEDRGARIAFYLSISLEKRVHPAEEALRPERPAGSSPLLPIADLRYKAVVRAKAGAEVLVGRRRIVVRRVVIPRELSRTGSQRAAGPCLIHLRLIRRRRVAREPLTDEGIRPVHAPLKVRTDDAVVTVDAVLAI